MRRKITWIRHGQSEWNAQGKWQGHTDTELSETGRQQALALRRRLEGSNFDTVYASDLKRAQATARLALPSSELIIEPRIREISFGVFEGRSWDTLQPQEAEFMKVWWVYPYAHQIEGGESMTCVNTRVSEFLEELPQETEIAIFTHGGVIRNAIWQVVGLPKEGGWSVQLDNTSLTVIEYLPEQAVIHRINDRAHLENL